MEENLFNQFENIAPIQPSPDWNENLMQRLDQTPSKQEKGIPSKTILWGIALLVAINIFSFSQTIHLLVKNDKQDNIKNIASEFLITTTSN
jgi:hypothetical protein